MSKVKVNNDIEVQTYKDAEKLLVKFIDGEELECRFKDLSSYNLLVEVDGLGKDVLLMKHAIKYIVIEKEETEMVKIADLKLSSVLKKVEVDQAKLEGAKKTLSNFGSFKSALIVRRNNAGDLILQDGYTKYLAAKELGIEELKAKIEG